MRKWKLLLVTMMALAMAMAFTAVTSFAAEKVDLDSEGCIVNWNESVVFNGGETNTDVSVIIDEEVISPDNYDVVYRDNTAVTDNARFRIIAREESELITGEFSNTYAITPCPINNITVKLSSTSLPVKFKKNDSGKVVAVAQKPTVTVSHNGIALVKDTDYTLDYSNSSSKNAGSYTVTVAAKEGGNYTGSVNKTYKITPCKMSGNVKATLSKASYTVKLKKNDEWKVIPVIQKPTVKSVTGYNGGKLTKGTDYTVKYSNSKSKKAGTYKVTIAAKSGSNYTGSIVKTYKIKPIKLNHDNFYAWANDRFYTGKKLKAKKVNISYWEDGGLDVDLIKGTHYTVTKKATFSNNKNIGWATINITIKGKGDIFSGEKKIPGSFCIGPARATIKSLKAGKKQLTVTWKKSSKADGYIIYYEGEKNGNWTALKKVTVKSKNTTSKTIKNLKSGYNYTVYVNSYKNVDGDKAYCWNEKSKTVKVK